jgi:hypothetical protein
MHQYNNYIRTEFLTLKTLPQIFGQKDMYITDYRNIIDPAYS